MKQKAKMGPVPRPPEERYWPKVDKRGPDECWPWLASKHLFGYGKFYIGLKDDGRQNLVDAHRYSWELHAGRQVPEGMVVRHSCDNPPCCNPSHLLLGTMQDNSDDACARDRMGRKLTRDAVVEIKRRRATGERIVDIGKDFGITHAMVSHIFLGRTWRHI